jgi:hypothetical protein
MPSHEVKPKTVPKKMTKQMPAALRQHLRDANIKDIDEISVATKLQERLSANIISYLQLTVLKIKHNTSMHQHKQLETHQARTEYASSLSERLDNISNY